jgi:hypothetical protein
MSAPKKPAAPPPVTEAEVRHETDEHHDAAADASKMDAEAHKDEAGKTDGKIESLAASLKPAKTQPSIDESIQLALASAGTATDASKEIIRLKKQVNELVEGSSRTNRVLLFAGVIFLFMSSIALGISVAFYYKAMNRFDAMTNVNRDALMAFAEEVNTFTESATRAERAVTASEKELASVATQQEEIKVALQGEIANQQAIQAKLAENSETIDQIPAATRKIVEDLLASNKLLIAQMADLMHDQVKTMEASNPKVEIAKQIEDIVKTQQAAAAKAAAMEAQKKAMTKKPRGAPVDDLIKYP